MTTPFTKSSGYLKSVIEAAEKVMKEASNETPTINHLELSEEPKKADDTPPFDPDPKRAKRPDEPKTAKGLARAAMIKQIRDKAVAEKKRLRKSLREEESEQIDETLKAIVTRKNKDGSYDEVGTSNRTVVQGTHSVVKRKAREWAKGAHRIELHYPSKFYKEPHKTIHVSEESEQIDETFAPKHYIHNPPGGLISAGKKRIHGVTKLSDGRYRVYIYKGEGSFDIHPEKTTKNFSTDGKSTNIHAIHKSMNEESEQTMKEENVIEDQSVWSKRNNKNLKIVHKGKVVKDYGTDTKPNMATREKLVAKEEIEVKEKSQASKIKKMVKGKTETTRGGKTTTGKPCDQVNVNPVHTDGIMSGTNTQSGVQ